MTPDEPSPGEPNRGEASRTVSRIMWFFAIVYVVEGIGQAKSGVIWQPLAYFLKQTQGWDAVKISVFEKGSRSVMHGRDRRTGKIRHFDHRWEDYI